MPYLLVLIIWVGINETWRNQLLAIVLGAIALCVLLLRWQNPPKTRDL